MTNNDTPMKKIRVTIEFDVPGNMHPAMIEHSHVSDLELMRADPIQRATAVGLLKGTIDALQKYQGVVGAAIPSGMIIAHLSVLGMVLTAEHASMTMESEPPDMRALLENAWGIIANVDGGDWAQTEEWRGIANKFSSEFHKATCPNAATNQDEFFIKRGNQ